MVEVPAYVGMDVQNYPLKCIGKTNKEYLI